MTGGRPGEWSSSELVGDKQSLRYQTGQGEGMLEVYPAGLQDPVLTLSTPEIELDGQTLASQGWYRPSLVSQNQLRRASESVFAFQHQDAAGLVMELTVRTYATSPVIRFRYRFLADRGRKLTGQGNRLIYSQWRVGPVSSISEIQLSQFESIVHSFLPHRQSVSQESLRAGCRLAGPVITWQQPDVCCLFAYEHGAEYPDAYLGYQLQADPAETGRLDFSLQALKGNYYHGQEIGPDQDYISPWFHFAVRPGSQDDLEEDYRRFFLEDICESAASRQPLIFYNSWNRQEREHYYQGLPYLNSMRQETILADIEIAARLGVDVFVIDTGWYNKTGDWLVNLERFPDNLRQIRSRLEAHQMKLGLWFNPIVAARTSRIMQEHPEYRMNLDGKDNYWGSIWETEESWGMCLASDYADVFIETMIRLHQELGVTYFKWDAIGQYGCDASWHRHGGPDLTAEERLASYSFQMGLQMIRIVEAVSEACPDIIVDFDVTEGGRFFGLGFLSVGKYFLMNNGPYFSSFDIPPDHQRDPDTINVFFHPGAARGRVCRQGTRFDSLIPSILFLTHFLPDPPARAQRNALASLFLGGNGIWGNLTQLSEDDIQLIRGQMDAYKAVAADVCLARPRVSGFIGASPEIHEKINPLTGRGLVSFFTRAAGCFSYLTRPIPDSKAIHIEGADDYQWQADGSLQLTVQLERDDARVVFIS